jgi:heme exporter protein B
VKLPALTTLAFGAAVALIFTALLGLTRAFVAEREQGMFDALVLTPCDRSAIWLAKSLAVLAFLGAAEVVALPAFAAFFSGIDGRTVAAVALADVGIAAVGTLFGAMAVAGRARELLLPLLFLPMAIPIVVGGVGGYLWFLVLYDAIFVVLAWATFEYVVAEA